MWYVSEDSEGGVIKTAQEKEDKERNVPKSGGLQGTMRGKG